MRPFPSIPEPEIDVWTTICGWNVSVCPALYWYKAHKQSCLQMSLAVITSSPLQFASVITSSPTPIARNCSPTLKYTELKSAAVRPLLRDVAIVARTCR